MLEGTADVITEGTVHWQAAHLHKEFCAAQWAITPLLGSGQPTSPAEPQTWAIAIRQSLRLYERKEWTWWLLEDTAEPLVCKSTAESE